MVNFEKTYWFEMHGDNFLDEFVYTSYMLLKSKGVTCKITSDFHPLINSEFTAGDVVFGSIQLCEHAFRMSDVTPPTYLGYPDECKPFLGRTIKEMDYDEVMQLEPPFFIKPKHEVKRFTGTIVDTNFWKHAVLNGHEDIEFYVSEPVNVLSEWRVFVHNKDVYGCQFYSGEPLILPDEYTMRLLIDKLIDMPIAYTLDFGVIGVDGEDTILIEINDMWGTGTYGVDPFKYVQAYVDRWNEIITK